MSPIDQELLGDFRIVCLEVLVPLEVQRRMPAIRRHWRTVTDGTVGKANLIGAFQRMSRDRRSVAEAVRDGIARADPDVIGLKNALYTLIGQDDALISQFFARPLTNGNEQCPYWDHAAYQNIPRKG